MYDANIIAQYIIDYCRAKGKPVSNLKLQKILYFVQAQFLVSLGEPCFYNRMEAWEFGPVVPDVYREYRNFGNTPITVSLFKTQGVISSRVVGLINNIVDTCNKYTTSSLVKLTHTQIPWIQARQSGYNAEITPESIRNFFVHN